MPIIDDQRLAELEEELGPEGLEEVLPMFLDEAAEGVARLEGAEGAELAGALHYLKGCALNIGLSELAEACIRAEKAVRRGEDATELVEAVRQAHARAAQALSGRLAA